MPVLLGLGLAHGPWPLLGPGHAPDGQDYDARTPAHLAASEGHAKVLELLLANGADPSLRDRRAAPSTGTHSQ